MDQVRIKEYVTKSQRKVHQTNELNESKLMHLRFHFLSLVDPARLVLPMGKKAVFHMQWSHPFLPLPFPVNSQMQFSPTPPTPIHETCPAGMVASGEPKKKKANPKQSCLPPPYILSCNSPSVNTTWRRHPS